MAHRIARLACLMACAAAVVYAVAFLFGPTYTTCSSGTIGPDQPFATFGPGSCRSANFFEVNASGPEGPGQAARALFFITLWTIAPFIALLGVALRARGHVFGVGLILAGFTIDATSIISMGGGFVFALLCGPLLLVTLIATLGVRVR
ncbi:MAG: hypothetical protein E6I44_02855 [Chloroflexi bacterium]|nr:MAG: hypothetical protein E6I44_02855 [Chloroflexota bacterium]